MFSYVPILSVIGGRWHGDTKDKCYRPLAIPTGIVMLIITLGRGRGTNLQRFVLEGVRTDMMCVWPRRALRRLAVAVAVSSYLLRLSVAYAIAGTEHLSATSSSSSTISLTPWLRKRQSMPWKSSGGYLGRRLIVVNSFSEPATRKTAQIVILVLSVLTGLAANSDATIPLTSPCHGFVTRRSISYYRC